VRVLAARRVAAIMATVVPIQRGMPQPAEPMPMMEWQTQGKIMLLFSVVVFFGQLFQIVIASAIARSANDGLHAELEEALKVLILVLIPSLVGRVIAGAAWSFGRVQSGDEKKGDRMVALFQTLWGNVLLLVLSAVSTFTTAILIGAVSPKWSILYESRSVDTTNNIKLLVGSSIALGCVCALETLYSHGKYFVRSEISAVASNVNDTLIKSLILLLAILMIGSVGVGAYFVVAIDRARKLDYAIGYESKALLLLAALDRMFVVGILGLVANSFTVLLYALKGCIIWFDRSHLARIVKLSASSVAVFAAAAMYGGVLPKLSYLGTYEADGKTIYAKTSNPLFLVNSLAAVNFFVMFGVVAVAHIMAFARAKL
jgi:hypothetical protein